MLYFSYNDYSDYKERKNINIVKMLKENEEMYTVENRTIKPKKRNDKEENEEINRIMKILKKKIELISFCKMFLDITNEEELKSIRYIDLKQINENADTTDTIISKITKKEMFIIIRVINKINSNMIYSLFDYSNKIIKRWEENKENINKRYPIVIPVVIQIGTKQLHKGINLNKKNIKYISYKDNGIEFSYNVLDAFNIFDNKEKTELIREFERIKRK